MPAETIFAMMVFTTVRTRFFINRQKLANHAQESVKVGYYYYYYYYYYYHYLKNCTVMSDSMQISC